MKLKAITALAFLVVVVGSLSASSQVDALSIGGHLIQSTSSGGHASVVGGDQVPAD